MAFVHPNRLADFYVRRTNNYVPACKIGQHVDSHSQIYTINLGTPEVLDADGILDAAAADDTGPLTYYPDDFKTGLTGISRVTGEFTTCPFGRDITAVGSAAGVTQDLTVVGYDYLGQKIVKTKAMNGTTPIALGVAYKIIESITIAVGASGETIDVGWGDELGLPFKTVKILAEQLEGVLQSSLGTLTAPVLTDPATVSTADPRGLYNPNGTLDGAKQLVITAMADPSVNSSGNGGLHGIRHYGG